MKIKLLLLSALLVFGTACSKTSSFDLKDPNAVIAPSSGFMIGDVEDNTGYQPREDEPDIDLEKSLKEALNKAVTKQGLEGNDYTISTKIINYEPGNAFHRWLMPGMGATKLETISTISDKNGNVIATIPVQRNISFGGAFTVGAWETVIAEVADEIILTIKKHLYKD